MSVFINMARCEAQQFKSEALSRGGNSSTEKLGKAGVCKVDM